MREFLFFAIGVLIFFTSAFAQQTAEKNVLLFLHNAWFENNKDGEVHKQFGSYDFEGIKAALATGGKVLAPERRPNTDPKTAADDLVKDIEALIASGKAPGSIKVIGASKGAYIAQLASESLNRTQIRWILVGGCHNERMDKGNVPKMTGKVLSVYDTSDAIAGPCRRYRDLFAATDEFEEIAISTGRDHGFQFVADGAWIRPALSW